MDAKPDDTVIGRREGPVAEIIFNNPAKHNAVSRDMWHKAGQLLEAFAAEDDLRVLVISGAGGKAFISGADISKFETERASREAVGEYAKISTTFYDALHGFPKPTIAKITGYCIGGGMTVAACCDLRFSDDRARFAIPAAKLGLGYGHVGVKRLADIVGLARTMEIFYSARQFSAAEALSMGLVNAVLPDRLLGAYVDDLAGQISENAPLTIAAIKAAARELTKLPGEQDFTKVEAIVKACFDSEDYAEGRRAFMEKRKPRFKGA